MPRRLYRVYVDESGHRSLNINSSPFFVLAAVMVRDSRDRDLRNFRDGICVDLGKPTKTTLHWAENIKKHDQRKFVSASLGALDYVRVSYVIVDKQSVRAARGGLGDHARMYNYAVRRLLERISWAIDDRGGEAILTFAHVRRFPYPHLTDYLTRLRSLQTEIRWKALRGMPRIDQPKRIHLLQIADIAAGCLDAALTPDAYGSLESAYLANLERVIYSRPRSDIMSYGMNVVGNRQSLRSRLPWWDSVF